MKLCSVFAFKMVLKLLTLFCVLQRVCSDSVAENELNSEKARHKSIASVLADEVDILKLLNITSKDQGISPVQGPLKSSTAYKLRNSYGNLPISNSSLVAQALSSASGFSLIFLYRQQRGNGGTLLSVNSPGRMTPWFQLNSNSKTGMLGVKYRTRDPPKMRQIEWKLPVHHKANLLASWMWMALVADYDTGNVRLDLDCLPSKEDPLARKNRSPYISIPQDALVYFAQEPGRKKKFLGTVQIAKVLPYPIKERPWECTTISLSTRSAKKSKPLL